MRWIELELMLQAINDMIFDQQLEKIIERQNRLNQQKEKKEALSQELSDIWKGKSTSN